MKEEPVGEGSVCSGILGHAMVLLGLKPDHLPLCQDAICGLPHFALDGDLLGRRLLRRGKGKRRADGADPKRVRRGAEAARAEWAESPA